MVNILEISADMVLCDVVATGYQVKNALLNEKLEKLCAKDRAMVYDVLETLLRHTPQT